ncbi:superoxide dismutase [Patellaria atrata CBS 101060]|uniref:Superoxide dismutase n=1 Tax=Patellaria atrata CBS 101060 TaxID=1346257 RepID=A0A9P4VP54_9PEZI|nr:superoxide dismutase [Patellaria atrata CBS 101060]
MACNLTPLISPQALEPHISAQIMTLHHTKHHQTYITNLNAALGKLSTAVSTSDITTQVALQPAIRFNAGGHINHSLFWLNLSPPSSPDAKSSAAPQLTSAINKKWGDMETFKSAFNTQLLGIQGSGWGWLVKEEGKNDLRIMTTKDQDPVVEAGLVPVFGVDMWEHAYYLQYNNVKADYVKEIWSVINWKVAEERFLGAQKNAFGMLKASM